MQNQGGQNDVPAAQSTSTAAPTQNRRLTETIAPSETAFVEPTEAPATIAPIEPTVDESDQSESVNVEPVTVVTPQPYGIARVQRTDGAIKWQRAR